VHSFGLQQRITALAFDMFTAQWPVGHDAVLFSNVLHDWPLDKCIGLCMSAFRALPPRGRVYVHEILLNDAKDGPTVAAAFSLKMARTTEGQQFTAVELRDILYQCGFERFTAVPTFGYYSVISATKP
jgi:acetylserotonin N-methyltransferase